MPLPKCPILVSYYSCGTCPLLTTHLQSCRSFSTACAFEKRSRRDWYPIKTPIANQQNPPQQGIHRMLCLTFNMSSKSPRRAQRVNILVLPQLGLRSHDHKPDHHTLYTQAAAMFGPTTFEELNGASQCCACHKMQPCMYV